MAETGRKTGMERDIKRNGSETGIFFTPTIHGSHKFNSLPDTSKNLERDFFLGSPKGSAYHGIVSWYSWKASWSLSELQKMISNFLPASFSVL